LSRQTAQGEEKVVDLAGPGQAIGEGTQFLCKPALMCAARLTDSVLRQIGRESMLAEIRLDSARAQ